MNPGPMLTNYGSGLNAALETLNKTSSYVISVSKIIDELIERHVGSTVVHGLRPFPRYSFKLWHSFLIKDSLGYDVYRTLINYFPVIFPELGVIRAIRFSGNVGRLDERDSFKFEKLQRCREDATQIAEELLGSFVTFGKIESENLSNLQLCISAFLGLIRPYAITFRRNISAVIPSPLSMFAYHYVSNGSDVRAWASPSAVLVHLYSRSMEVKKLNISEEWIRVAIIKGNLISCTPISSNFHFSEIGPFPIAIPLDQKFGDFTHLFYSLKNNDLIAYFSGIFIFNDRDHPYLLSYPFNLNRGYFLVYSELSIPFDVEIAAVVGEPWRVNLDGKRRREIYPALCCDVKSFERARSGFLSEIQRIVHRSRAENLLQSQTIDVFSSPLEEFFYLRESFKYYLSPPLITMATLDNIPTDKIFKSIWNIIDIISKAEGKNINIDFELITMFEKDQTLRKIYCKLRDYSYVWARAFSMNLNLATKFALGYIM